MTFDEMTNAMGASTRRMRREGWADVAMGDGSRRGEMWIEMRMDEENRPFAVLMLKDGDRLIQAPRWTATLTDRAATDWAEVIT
jgi:hypothetical protein